jgi:rod shape-determining protein MreB and related proteins
MAAAIGAGLPVYEPTGNMVVGVCGGTTEVAVISLGGIVTCQSVRVGGGEMDQAIIVFAKKQYSLMLGERTAEEIKMAVGSAYPSPDEPHTEIRGRDLVSGLPKTIVIGAGEVRHAIAEPVSTVVDIVKTTLDTCPPEPAGDTMDRGIALTGDGALLRGLDERLREKAGMPIQLADNPLESVVLGTGKCFEDFDALQQVLVPERRRLAGQWPARPTVLPVAVGVGGGVAALQPDLVHAQAAEVRAPWGKKRSSMLSPPPACGSVSILASQLPTPSG